MTVYVTLPCCGILSVEVMMVGKELIRLTFDEFAMQLRTVFDVMAKERNPVLVEREGALYRLAPEAGATPQDVWAGYDPQRVRQALRRSAGALADVDPTALLKDIHAQRQQAERRRPA